MPEKVGRVLLFVLGTATIATGCRPSEPLGEDQELYTSFSRFTDPGDRTFLLDELPETPVEIASVAQNLTVHHNLLAHLDVPSEQWPEVRSVWPPRMTVALDALRQSGPGDLLGERRVTERLRGACMSESHLLAGLLRYRDVPVRIRAGYFKDVYTNEDHLVAFWEKNARAKGVAAQLYRDDPERWREVNHEYTRGQVSVNKYVEHWVAEYWDEKANTWRRLDANRDFLKAMSDIDVGYHLPREHFEYAFEAWQKMRTSDSFNRDQYAEWPQDGRSHIRSQLLWDFYSLLNHDIAGFDQSRWDSQDTASAERTVYEFVKLRKYEELIDGELEELDALASLLSDDPSVEDLRAFYRTSETLRIRTLEADPTSFVSISRAG